MPSFNKIIIVGHLGRDPLLRYTPQSTAVCDFSVATSEKRGGEESVTWFKVSVWGRQAEVVSQYVKKGDPLYIEGRLKQTEYTDKEGEKRTVLEVNASDIQFIKGRDSNEAPAPKPKTDDDDPF